MKYLLLVILCATLISCKKQPTPDTYHQVDTVKVAVYEQTIKGMWQCYDGAADTMLIDKDNMTFWYIWYSKNVCRYASCSDTIYFYTGDKVFPEYNYILSNDTLILSFGSIYSRDSICFKRILTNNMDDLQSMGCYNNLHQLRGINNPPDLLSWN